MTRRKPRVAVDPAFRRQVRTAQLQGWAVAALDYLTLPERTTLEIAVVDDHAIRELNQSYRGLDEATDVLSFPYTPLAAPAPFYGDAPQQRPTDPAFATPRGAGLLLGEVLIALPYAQRQAKEQGHSLEAELQTLLAHGILHLVGHDHEEPEDAAAMEQATREIMEQTAQSSAPVS